MSATLVTLFGAVGAVAAMLAVLVPVILSQGKSLRREIDTLRDDMGALRNDMGVLRVEVRADFAEVRADLAEVRRDLHGLSDRVARIEGALTGPWRPTNGSSAAEAQPEPEASA